MLIYKGCLLLFFHTALVLNVSILKNSSLWTFYFLGLTYRGFLVILVLVATITKAWMIEEHIISDNVDVFKYSILSFTVNHCFKLCVYSCFNGTDTFGKIEYLTYKLFVMIVLNLLLYFYFNVFKFVFSIKLSFHYNFPCNLRFT